MRNTKRDRQLRAQTAPSLRRRLRVSGVKIANLQRQVTGANATITSLVTTNLQLRGKLSARTEIILPTSLLDEIMSRFLEELGKNLTQTVLAEHPREEWAPMVAKAARLLLSEAYNRHPSTFCMPHSFRMFVEDRLDAGDLQFSFRVQNISSHRVIPEEVRKGAIIRDPSQQMVTLDMVGDYWTSPQSPLDGFVTKTSIF